MFYESGKVLSLTTEKSSLHEIREAQHEVSEGSGHTKEFEFYSQSLPNYIKVGNR